MVLFRLLSWPYLRRHLLRWILTVAGIVLGVAVFIAIHTASQSMFSAFDKTVDQIAGSAQLEVSAGEFGFDESTLERVQAVPEVSVAVPIIEATVEIPASAQGSILILGVDLTGDRSLRDYDLEDGDQAVIDDPLVFLAQPDSLMITTEFARRNGLAVNSKLSLLTIEGEKGFTVRGIMRSAGLAQAFGGNLAIMDIYAAQHVLGRDRRFDRIELRAKDSVSVEDCQNKVREALGPGYEVEPPSARGKHFEALLRSYSAWILISSLFALLVGMFIIYNSFAIAVTQRRREVGILRALGATRSQVQRLFLVESAIAGFGGSVFGAIVGLIAARTIVGYTGAVMQLAGGAAQRVTEVSISPALLIFGIAIGVGTSLLAAWVPARNAARLDPVQALQKGKFQAISVGEHRSQQILAGALSIFCLLCLLYPDSQFLFYSGYISMIIAGLLLAPTFSLLLAKWLHPVLKRVFSAEGALAADSLVQAPRRTWATVGALMLSLSMVVDFGGFISAFYVSVNDWVDDVLNSDFFVSASANLTTRTMTFPNELGSIIEKIDGVKRVELVRNARVLFRQTPVMVIAADIERMAQAARRAPLAGDREDMYRLTAEGKGTIVSGTFATNNKLRLHDIVDVPTPSGLLRLPIVGIVRDYSDLQGSLYIDRALYEARWKDTTSNMARIYIEEGQDAARVRQRIVDALAGRQRLLVLTNGEVRGWILNLLDQWFALSYSQIFVAMLVAVLGIVNTLTVSITDRKRELGVMQAVGGLRSQVRRTVWIEAVSIAAIGLVVGIGMGAINLHYSLDMLKRDLGGIELDYVFPASIVLATIPVILAAGFIAALGPAESAVRTKLTEALEYE